MQRRFRERDQIDAEALVENTSGSKAEQLFRDTIVACAWGNNDCGRSGKGERTIDVMCFGWVETHVEGFEKGAIVRERELAD